MRTTLRKRLLRLTCISVVVASLIVTIAAEIGIFSLADANTEQNGLTVTSIAEKTFNEEIIYLSDCLLEAEENLLERAYRLQRKQNRRRTLRRPRKSSSTYRKKNLCNQYVFVKKI